MNNPPIADGSRINPAIAELAAIPRWVVWRLEWRLNKKTGEKDSTKVPYTTGLRHASSIDPKTWDTFENCRLVAFEAGAADGVGIVLDGNDDLIGVDLDDCLERDGTLTPWAKAIAERLNSYTEITPSGRGVRIFVRGALPPGRRKKGNTEIYSSGRFLTVTGNRRPEFPNRIRRCPKAIAAVFNEVFGDTPAPPDCKPNGHADLGELPEPAPDIARYLKLFSESDYASPSERDLAVACAMARHGRTDQRIAAVLRALRAGETKADRRDYIERTIARARQEIESAEQNLEHLVERAADDPGAPFEGEAIDFLAALKVRDLSAYERAVDRLKKAKVRIGPLERAIERRLPEISAGPGRVLTFEPIEPWPSPVAGAELLDALSAHLERFVVMSSEHAAVATVLWALHAHSLDAFTHTPRLLVTSPTRECGKSHVMEWLAGIVPRPFDVVDPTGPTLFRPIEAHTPTVLIDEGDLVSWDERRDVRAVINAGHSRFSGGIPRCVGDDNEVRTFCVWAPLAYAMIGKPLDTMLSRSIVIPMQRMMPDQAVEYRREDRDQGHAELARKCARWVADHTDALRAADPDLPVKGRKANCWRPLVAIADVAGGDWPKRAREAAQVLSGMEPDVQGLAVQLLADIKRVFGKRATAIQTDRLLTYLTGLPEAPWKEYGRARKEITAAQLAVLLKPFGIKPAQYKVEGIKHRGYRLKHFEPVWSRYLEPEQ